MRLADRCGGKSPAPRSYRSREEKESWTELREQNVSEMVDPLGAAKRACRMIVL